MKIIIYCLYQPSLFVKLPVFLLKLIKIKIPIIKKITIVDKFTIWFKIIAFKVPIVEIVG